MRRCDEEEENLMKLLEEKELQSRDVGARILAGPLDLLVLPP